MVISRIETHPFFGSDTIFLVFSSHLNPSKFQKNLLVLYRNQSELNHSDFGLLTLFFTPPVSQLSAAFSTSGEVLPDGVKLLGLSEKDLFFVHHGIIASIIRVLKGGFPVVSSGQGKETWFQSDSDSVQLSDLQAGGKHGSTSNKCQWSKESTPQKDRTMPRQKTTASFEFPGNHRNRQEVMPKDLLQALDASSSAGSTGEQDGIWPATLMIYIYICYRRYRMYDIYI